MKTVKVLLILVFVVFILIESFNSSGACVDAICESLGGTCVDGNCVIPNGDPPQSETSFEIPDLAPCPDNTLCTYYAYDNDAEVKLIKQEICTITASGQTDCTIPSYSNLMTEYCQYEGQHGAVLKVGRHKISTAPISPIQWKDAQEIDSCELTNVDWDKIEFCTTTCTQKPVMWVPEAPRGGQCCGDDDKWKVFEGIIDPKTGETFAIPPDDPDWSEAACKQCVTQTAQFPGAERVWDPDDGCCGDDENDFVDVSEIFCTQCPQGGDPSKRMWEPEAGDNGQCCGNNPKGFDGNNKWHKADDADMGPSACTRCLIGDNKDNPGIRIWDATKNQCCGDDVDGSSLDISQLGKENWETELDDPDWSEESCLSCPIGSNQGGYRDYEQSISACCGDDTSDCGFASGTFLCRMDANYTDPVWYSSDSPAGDIVDIPCNKDVQFLAKGNVWRECSQSSAPDGLWLDHVLEHDYLCANVDGNFTIYECVGNDFAQSFTAGTRKDTGEAIALENDTYYCSYNGSWVLDLDKNNETCTFAGFSMTGRYCCGEEPAEYYNDFLGGCWNSTAVWNGSLVYNNTEPLFHAMLFYSPQFKGCKSVPEFLQITDAQNGQQLVLDNSHCTLVGRWFCSYTGVWNLTLGKNKTSLSYIPWQQEQPDEQIAECCQQTECWNGTVCVRDQSNRPKSEPYKNIYRCINGTWQTAQYKYDWNNDKFGFCPQESMCLVNPDGRFENNGNTSSYNYLLKDDPSGSGNPQCIANGQFILDHYCENGRWTSRTKRIALQFLEVLEQRNEDEYSIHCDQYNRAVNMYDYTFGQHMGTLLGSDLCKENKVPCSNNVCVLSFSDKVVFGTSINDPLNQSGTSLLQVFGKTDPAYCNNVKNTDDKYYACQNPDVWFNPSTQSVIYTQDEIVIPSGTFTDSIRKLFYSIINFVTSFWKPSYPGSSILMNLDFLNKTKDFSRLYLAAVPGKRIEGAIEKVSANEYLTVQYEGFMGDICQSVQIYNRREPGYLVVPPSSRKGTNEIVCAVNGTNTTIFSIKPFSGEWVATKAWEDLTVKVRMS